SFSALNRKAHRSPLALLAFGGSQGSRVLNQALMAALAGLPAPDRLAIVHQTGEAMLPEVRAAYAAAGRPAEVVAFIDDMAARFETADLVRGRRGCTACAAQ